MLAFSYLGGGREIIAAFIYGMNVRLVFDSELSLQGINLSELRIFDNVHDITRQEDQQQNVSGFKETQLTRAFRRRRR